MDPMERRKKIYEMAEDDAQYRRIKADFDKARDLFDRIALSLPEEERNLLQSYPGMGHFLHHRMLTIICENMCFEDEMH